MGMLAFYSLFFWLLNSFFTRILSLGVWGYQLPALRYCSTVVVYHMHAQVASSCRTAAHLWSLVSLIVEGVLAYMLLYSARHAPLHLSIAAVLNPPHGG